MSPWTPDILKVGSRLDPSFAMYAGLIGGGHQGNCIRNYSNTLLPMNRRKRIKIYNAWNTFGTTFSML